jgi:hypothetical protein
LFNGRNWITGSNQFLLLSRMHRMCLSLNNVDR